MLRRMIRPALALLLLCACPADDWAESMESSSEGSASMTTSATASGSATATTTTGATQTGTGTGTTGETETGTETGTTAATTTATDTGADTTTGAAECEAGLEPAAITEVDGCEGPIGQPQCSEGQMHVTQGTEVDWLSDPPHSGPHYPTWEGWGEHADVVPRGNWVHNLEHGGIVLSYRCADPCDAELEILRDVIEQRPELRILLTPDPFLPGRERFAAISWTWIHRFDAPDLEELLCFADQHENHAPEDVP
jgi:hypothetical protein